jgi:anti-anti-sigma factor
LREREASHSTQSVCLHTGDGVARVTVDGELDMFNVPALEQALADALAGCRDATIQLDMTRVSFMDSTGLRALLTARQRAASAGCRFRLVGAAPSVRRVLELTRTASLFEPDAPRG